MNIQQAVDARRSRTTGDLAPPAAAVAIDSVLLMRAVGVLAHNSMHSRAVATPRSAKARTYVESCFRAELQPSPRRFCTRPSSPAAASKAKP
jgi:hypothetical protein